MITTNSDGQALSAEYELAVAQPMVAYDMRLYRDGQDAGYGIKRAQLELGAGYAAVDDLATFAPCQLYQTQMTAQLYDVTGSLVGDELEVRVGVETGNGYEYVTVAWVTVTSSKTWAAVTDVVAVGRMAKMQAPHGLPSGDYSPSAIAAAVGAASGVSVALGAFSGLQDAHVEAGGTCRDALQSLCARLGGYACELGEGVSVLPYSSATTADLVEENMTAAPEIGTLYEADGLTVEAAEGSYVSGTGRVVIEDATATASTAAQTWANLQGYSYTPANVTTAIIDPRVTVADVLALTIGGTTYSVPARGISATFDGGWFGTISAAGLSAEGEDALVEGPLSAAIGGVALAADAAQTAAQNAEEIANAVGQHVWDYADGLHVTEAEKDAFLTTPAGRNILMNALGILLRDAATNRTVVHDEGLTIYDGQGNAATNIIANLLRDLITLGYSDESHAEIDYHSLQLIDREGTTYFHVSDLRDATGSADVSETFTGDGWSFSFYLKWPITSVTSVTVNGSSVGFYVSGTNVVLTSTPAQNAEIVVNYRTDSDQIKAYTVGTRRDDVGIGPMSVAAGAEVGASGEASHAEGAGAVASGYYSHAEGSATLARGDCSHAEGRHTTAAGVQAHAEGWLANADGRSSHAEGESTTAGGEASHAEGSQTHATGLRSHAQNNGTTALGIDQTTIGRYNIEDTTSALIIGNGTAATASNALTVDWSGNVEAAGNVSATGGNFSGDVSADSMHVTRSASGDTGFIAERSDTGAKVGTLVGTGGTNHGVYSFSDSRWLVYSDGSSIRTGGALVVPGNVDLTSGSFRRKYSNMDVTTDVTSTTNGTLAVLIDKNAEMVGQIRAGQFTNSRDGLELVARNKSRDGNNTIRQNVLALYVDDSGNQTYSVSSPANFRSAIGANNASNITTGTLPKAQGGTGKTNGLAWTGLGSFTGTNSLTIDLTDYSEVCIVANFDHTNSGTTTHKMVTSTVPKNILSTTVRELWLGGGKSSGSTANGGALRAVVNITSTKVTGVISSADGTDHTSGTTWRVYAR